MIAHHCDADGLKTFDPTHFDEIGPQTLWCDISSRCPEESPGQRRICPKTGRRERERERERERIKGSEEGISRD